MTLKIRTDLLSQFPFKVINEHQLSNFSSHKKHLPLAAQKAFTRLLKTIDAFLYSSGTALTLRTFNDEESLNNLLDAIISFIYKHVEGDNIHLYNFCSYAQKLLRSVAKSGGIQLRSRMLSKASIHPSVVMLLEKAEQVDENKLSFYKGWVVFDNKGLEIDIQLGSIREAYGKETTQKIFEAFKKLCRASTRETALTHYKHLTGLFSYFIKLAPSFEKLEQYLERSVAVYYLSLIFNVELKKHLGSKGSGSAFCKAWQNKMFLYEACFIKHSIFQEPIFPLPVPKFKRSLILSGSHNTQISEDKHSSGIFNEKLITKVPLKYADNDVVKEVIKDIRRDIDHVLFVCDKAMEHNYKKLLNFEKYASVASANILGEARQFESFIDRRNAACATFSKYLWDHPGKDGGYTSFLGFRDTTSYLNSLFCLPTLHVLYPLLLKLVHAHPAITESWLLNWELFDESGKKKGFMKSGKAFVIQSVKKRKGADSALQVITLTDESKALVEKVLAHTSVAREYLKSKGSDEHRFVLLTASLNGGPSRVKGITNLNKIDSSSVFTRLLKSRSPLVQKERAMEIAARLTITRLRASAGVEVFLKTNSVKKMCAALDHKELRDDLIKRYLPDPILRFFQDRWIRIFQNAIVYEAMSSSKFLHNAIDIPAGSLEEFLKNHKIKKISGHIWDGNVFPLDTKETKHDGLILISTPLLRILLFFFNASHEDIAAVPIAKPVLETWIQLSGLIITQLEFQISSPDVLTDEFDEEIIQMYKDALRRPISLANFVDGRVHEAS